MPSISLRMSSNAKKRKSKKNCENFSIVHENNRNRVVANNKILTLNKCSDFNDTTVKNEVKCCDKNVSCDGKLIENRVESLNKVENSKETCIQFSDLNVDNQIVPETSNTLDVINDILNEICDTVISSSENGIPQDYIRCDAEIMDARTRKQIHRRTYVLSDNDDEQNNDSSDSDGFEERPFTNRDSLYSVDESVENFDEEEFDENVAPVINAINDTLINDFNEENEKKPEEKKPEEKKPKKSRMSLITSFFGKKDKDKDKPKKNGFGGMLLQRKYSSNVDLSKESPIVRTPSLRKKLTHLIQKDAPNLLKRSLSFRDINKRKEKDLIRGISESKNKEWAASLQSLVENDTGVCYHDLSFINYDAFNTVSYQNTSSSNIPVAVKNNEHKILQRAQSLSVSLGSRRSSLTKGTCVPRQCQSTIDLSEDSEALSLPSLHHLNQEDAEDSSRHKYRQRPRSINSDDGRPRPCGNGSFKSAGSGCAKLKRHNACRQKSRDVISLQFDSRSNSESQNSTVRSRSLNHLDTLEMRQGIMTSADPGLKDCRSEPDCTKPLLAPAGEISKLSTPTTETPSTGKRHMLSRSQKSSSECFSVNFEVGDESTWENELFFPAARGITLQDSFSKLCESRNIDLSICDAWLQDKESNTNTWLPFAQDTACLVGKHVRITAKDASIKKLSGSFHSNHTRKLSAGAKPRTGSFFNTSSEDSNSVVSLMQDFDLNKKQTKQRWSGFFSNNKDTKMELLIEQLNNYSKHGIPICHIYPQGQCESIDALYKLEEDWKDIISYKELSEKLQQQQTALWELIKTEVAYIKTLKVVTDLFLACLKNLQSVNLLKEIDTEKLFSNITEILDANVLFWRNSLFPLVRDMRKYKQPPCIESMGEGFLKIRETFQAYFRFCAEQSRCQHYCRENHVHNELFTAYLAWCETQKECNRLRLMDILVQPMQRLTKYGLLLKAILKNTEDEVEKDYLILMNTVSIIIKSISAKTPSPYFKNPGVPALIREQKLVFLSHCNYPHLSITEINKLILQSITIRQMHIEKIKSVDEFVNSVNFSLKQKQDNERIKGIMARIESYDIVESKDDDLDKLLKPCSHLDLNRPMLNCSLERQRHLLLEGDLKLKDSNTSKMEVHCFLLTDMLLICKPSTKKGGATLKVIRQPYLVDRLEVTELNKETPSLAVVYKNEFNMATAAFILQNTDTKKLKSWKDCIKKAQTLYAQAKETEESLEADFSSDYNLEGDYHSLQLAPRSPLATSSRASRVSSLAHSHSGSVEMNEQSSVGSVNQSRAVSVENDNRTASMSSDEGVQPLPPDKSPISQKNSLKRFFNKTPNTLSVQPYGSLGQSLPNLTLGSPNVGTLSLNLNQNTLSVPNTKNGSHLLSPTHRGISYPPPSPTRGNLRRGLAISQNKNPPLIKTRHVTSTTNTTTGGQAPTSFDFDVPVIAGPENSRDVSFDRGQQQRQAILKRLYRSDDKRYHTAGVVDDIKKNCSKDNSIHKRLSWNCSSQPAPSQPEPQT